MDQQKVTQFIILVDNGTFIRLMAIETLGKILIFMRRDFDLHPPSRLRALVPNRSLKLSSNLPAWYLDVSDYLRTADTFSNLRPRCQINAISQWHMMMMIIINDFEQITKSCF